MNIEHFKLYLGLAWENLTHRKKRAYLTIIGIFIGIMAVVALVSLGQGLEAGVDAEFSKLGADKIFIQPASLLGASAASPTPLKERDLDSVRRAYGVSEALAANYRSAKIEWGEDVGFYFVASAPSGADEERLYRETWQVAPIKGRQLARGDTYKAIVGYDYTRRDVFEKPLDIGSRFLVNNISYEVVGINKRIGNPQDDRMIIVPERTYTQAIPTDDEFDMIIARSQAGFLPSEVAENIKRDLRSDRNVEAGDEDFSVQTAEQLSESFGSVLIIIQVVLTGIAAISLVVGAVGITNTMYTAVLERTKEIGIMKAVGARNEAILSIFLIESGILGLIGGMVGVILGLLISYGTSVAAEAALGTTIIQFYASWWLVLGSLLFGFIVGAAAGLLPARQASKMSPVDSLRYE